MDVREILPRRERRGLDALAAINVTNVRPPSARLGKDSQ